MATTILGGRIGLPAIDTTAETSKALQITI